MKWDMGWMHDTLEYFKQDPIGRRYHHHKLTFRSVYFWSENFVLPLSHDEVVHGKKSLIEKMPGDLWQRFANLRLLYGMMWAQPGKKLLFQGSEFGQYKEWAHDSSLDWNLLGESAFHTQLMAFVAELNRLYQARRRCTRDDVGVEGFEWIDANDAENSVFSFLRQGGRSARRAAGRLQLHAHPAARLPHRPALRGRWRELLNSDAAPSAAAASGTWAPSRPRAPVPRPPGVGAPDAAAARRALPGARALKRRRRSPFRSRGEGELCSPEPFAGGFGNPPRVPISAEAELQRDARAERPRRFVPLIVGEEEPEPQIDWRLIAEPSPKPNG